MCKLLEALSTAVLYFEENIIIESWGSFVELLILVSDRQNCT